MSDSTQYEKHDDESYEQHAARLADIVGLRVEIKQGVPKCPAWGKSAVGGVHCPYGKCDGHHGKHWRVALHTAHSNYELSFWQSVHDDMQPYHKPGLYDVLSCLDWQGPVDPDEIAEEYGPMKPSQAIACAEQNRALRALWGVGGSARAAILGHIQ
jgi:hypothetical protein